MKKLLITALFALTLVGCASLRPIAPMTYPVPAESSELVKVKKGILAGAVERGWTYKELGGNKVELTLLNRKHKVVVDVAYNTKDYTVTYKDSENMKYDKEKNAIHGKYANWVRNLNASIQKNLIK